MKKEKSCGAIIYKYTNKEILFLIIKQTKGHYSFPKGHVEKNETEIETALREVKEETGLNINIKSSFRQVITYMPNESSIKDVVFFLGNVIRGTIKPQEEEVSEIKWLTYNQALNTITYNDDKNVLKEAYKYIMNNNLLTSYNYIGE